MVADISRTVREKLADGRNHDSTDQRGRGVGSLLGGSVDNMLSSIMNDFSISGEAGDVSDETILAGIRLRAVGSQEP